MEHRAKRKDQEAGKRLHALSPVIYASNAALGRKVRLFAQAVIFLVILQVLLFVFPSYKAQAQGTTAQEISQLAARLDGIARQLISIDNKLKLLEEELRAVTRYLGVLKEEEKKPRSFLRRILGMGRGRRKIGRLYTRSLELYDEMIGLRTKRKPLIKKLVPLTDVIIEKSSSRITILGEAFLSSSDTVSEEAERQLSELSTIWGIAERARKVREKYAPNTIKPEDEWSLPTLLTDDPAELRLLAATLRDVAASERDNIAELAERIQLLKQGVKQLEYLLKVSKDWQRREEEREASGIGFSQPSWDEMETERDIKSKKKELVKLEIRKQKSEEKAQRSQEQAEQIDAEFKGKLEDD